MIQRVSLLIILFCFSSIALGQQLQEKHFQLDIDSLLTKVYENVNLSVLPTNYLIDKSVWVEDPGRYTGNRYKDSIGSIHTWKRLCRGLLESCVKKDNGVIRIVDKLNSLKNDKSDTVSIGCIYTTYNRIRADALEKKLILQKGINLYDYPGRTSSPYETKLLFSAGALTQPRQSDVIFILEKKLFISTSRDTISKIQIDWGNEQELQDIHFDQPIPIHYTNAGEKIISLKITTSNKMTYESRFTIHVPDSNTYTLRDGSGSFTPDYSLRLKQRTDDCSAPRGAYCFEGMGYVFLGCDKVLDKPIIVVEGFDDTNSIGWLDMLNQYNLKNLLNTVHDYGYDVVLLDFEDARRDIKRNAAVLKALINLINTIKTGQHELVVMGASMGGLVARYALTQMEKESVDHNVRLMMCYDTPHQGATIPLGIQKITEAIKFVRHFDDFFKDVKEFSNEWEALNSDAAKQMLVYHLDDKRDVLYDDFREELKDMGNYPQRCRNVAIFDGSNNQSATPTSSSLVKLVPGDKIFEIDNSSWWHNIEVQMWAVPDPTQGSQKVARAKIDIRITPWVKINVYNSEWTYSGTQPYDNAPGGLLYSQYSIASALSGLGATTFDRDYHCFVPSVSAIDLDPSVSSNLFYNIQSNNVVVNGLTPFDAIYGKNSNSLHVRLNVNLASIIINEIQPVNLYLYNQTVSSDKDFRANRNVYVGYNSTDNFVIKNNAHVSVQAGKGIVIGSGFKMEEGSTFEAKLVNPPDGCPSIGPLGIKADDIEIELPSILTMRSDEKKNSNIDIKVNTDSVQIYPNPAEHYIYIQYTHHDPIDVCMVSIHDGWGRLIKWIDRRKSVLPGTLSWKVDIAELPRGIYYCTVRTEKSKIVKRISIE